MREIVLKVWDFVLLFYILYCHADFFIKNMNKHLMTPYRMEERVAW